MGNWEDLQKKYRWATFGENCPICDAMANRVYTYDIWMSAAVLPGFHLHCNCQLRKVDDDTPMSDLDVFGSDFDIMLDNHYFMTLNYNVDWQPYNRYMVHELEQVMQETGLSAGEALKILTNRSREGTFVKSIMKAWDQFFQWRVFRTLKANSGVSDTIFSLSGLAPAPSTLKPYLPGQTYKSNKYLGP